MLSVVRIFSKAAIQAKNASQRALIMPNTLPREEGAIMRYKDVERSNVQTSLSWKGFDEACFHLPVSI
jgi:hypothetical protein